MSATDLANRSRKGSIDPVVRPKRSSTVSAKISVESMEEAEELLPKMSITALEKLKGFLRTKADSVRRDLAILTRQEEKLLKISRTLEAENGKYVARKKRVAAALTLMRDNLCKIPGFNCKTFQMRGEAVVHDTVRDQWLAKGAMLESMEDLILTGIREDKELSDELVANENEWRAKMADYLYTEEQLVVAQCRLEDLRTQSKNYRHLAAKLERKVKASSAETAIDRNQRITRHKVNSAGLRDKVTAPIPEEYTESAIAANIEQFQNYIQSTGSELEAMRDTVVQVQAFDQIRQHTLQMIIENGGIPGRHGIDHGVWSEIVQSSVKTSRAELEEKIRDLNDMTSFKQEALKSQIRENDALLAEQSLTFPTNRTRSFEFDSRSRLQDFSAAYDQD